MTGVVGACAVALLLVAAPRLLEDLPTSTLAAVVISSALGLFEASDLARIYRIEQWEFWLSILCFAGVIVLGAVPGIARAIVVAVIEFLWDGWRPYSAVLGKVEGIRGFHDITRYPNARQIRASSCFAGTRPCSSPTPSSSGNAFSPWRQRLLPPLAGWSSPEPVTSVDVTAADALSELEGALRAAGTELRFAELKDPVKDKLRRFGLLESLGGEAVFFPTIGSAVDEYLNTHAMAAGEDADW
jgi:MFS superfamily sulfate permease-like transporter